MAGAGASSSSANSEPQLPSPISYTPKHLADKILTSRSALEGERKQVTVLFADVKGSMDLAGKLDPEEWHKVMDGFFAILAKGVHRFEGTVNQYTGDGIMALFGAPIAHEDHARRACYAALHLSEELRPYANQLRLRQGLNFSVRMGINSGEVKGVLGLYESVEVTLTPEYYERIRRERVQEATRQLTAVEDTAQELLGLGRPAA